MIDTSLTGWPRSWPKSPPSSRLWPARIRRRRTRARRGPTAKRIFPPRSGKPPSASSRARSARSWSTPGTSSSCSRCVPSRRRTPTRARRASASRSSCSGRKGSRRSVVTSRTSRRTPKSMSTAPASPSNTPGSTRIRPARRRVVALGLSLVVLSSPARAAIVEEIVAKVNNRIVSKSEFEERSAYILKQIYQQYSGHDLDKRLTDARETMLANMITELLLVERAQSLLDLDKVRKNLIDDFRKQQNIASDEELEKMLKEQNMTRKDLEEQLIRLAVPQEIINYEVRRKISVSDSEIKIYYDQHSKAWESPASVTFNEIVLFYEDANRPEVQGRGEGIVRGSRGVTDFAELVQKYSEAGSKETGGFLGPLSAEELHPAIAKAVFDMKVDEVSAPIDTGRSIHI